MREFTTYSIPASVRISLSQALGFQPRRDSNFCHHLKGSFFLSKNPSFCSSLRILWRAWSVTPQVWRFNASSQIPHFLLSHLHGPTSLVWALSNLPNTIASEWVVVSSFPFPIIFLSPPNFNYKKLRREVLDFPPSANFEWVWTFWQIQINIKA